MQATAAVSEGRMVDISTTQRSGFSNGKYVNTEVKCRHKADSVESQRQNVAESGVMFHEWKTATEFLVLQRSFGPIRGRFRDELKDKIPGQFHSWPAAPDESYTYTEAVSTQLLFLNLRQSQCKVDTMALTFDSNKKAEIMTSWECMHAFQNFTHTPFYGTVGAHAGNTLLSAALMLCLCFYNSLHFNKKWS